MPQLKGPSVKEENKDYSKKNGGKKGGNRSKNEKRERV